MQPDASQSGGGNPAGMQRMQNGFGGSGFVDISDLIQLKVAVSSSLHFSVGDYVSVCSYYISSLQRMRWKLGRDIFHCGGSLIAVTILLNQPVTPSASVSKPESGNQKGNQCIFEADA